MAGWTDAEEAAILNWYFRNTAKTPPSSLFVGLLTAAGNDDGTYTEIGYTGYGREEIVAPAGWNAASEGDPSSCANANDITFGVMTGGVGGTVTHWGLFSLVAAGVLLFHGQVTVPGGGLPVSDGVQPQFAAGSLLVRLGG